MKSQLWCISYSTQWIQDKASLESLEIGYYLYYSVVNNNKFFIFQDKHTRGKRKKKKLFISELYSKNTMRVFLHIQIAIESDYILTEVKKRSCTHIP